MQDPSELTDAQKYQYILNYEPIEPKIDQWANHIFNQLGAGKAITNYDTLLTYLQKMNANLADPNQKTFYCWAIFKAMLYQGNPLPVKERMFIIAMLVIEHKFDPYYSNKEYFQSSQGFLPSYLHPYQGKTEAFWVMFDGPLLATGSVKSTWKNLFDDNLSSLIFTVLTNNPSKFRRLFTPATGKAFDDVFIENHLVVFLMQQRILRSPTKHSKLVKEGWSDYSWSKPADDSVAAARAYAVQLLDNYARNNIPLVGGLISRCKHYSREHRVKVSALRDELTNHTEKYTTKASITRYLLREFCDYTNGWDKTATVPNSSTPINYLGSYAKRTFHLADPRITLGTFQDKTEESTHGTSSVRRDTEEGGVVKVTYKTPNGEQTYHRCGL